MENSEQEAATTPVEMSAPPDTGPTLPNLEGSDPLHATDSNAHGTAVDCPTVSQRSPDHHSSYEGIADALRRLNLPMEVRLRACHPRAATAGPTRSDGESGDGLIDHHIRRRRPRVSFWSPAYHSLSMSMTRPRKKLPHVNTLQDVVSLISSVQKIVVISGAGISTSCGIPDFRSQNGLYNLVSHLGLNLSDPQLVFNIHFFRRDPRPFYLISQRLFQSEDSHHPSPTHQFIAQLDAHGKLLRNYTQNIDNLEQKASITHHIQCHGSYSDAYCMNTMDEIMPFILKGEVAFCPRCPEFKGEFTAPVMKPSIVMFGEQLPDVFHDHFRSDMEEAELVIAVGSSMKVAPTPAVLINREVVGRPHEFDVELLGDCDSISQELMSMLGWIPHSDLKPEIVPCNIALTEKMILRSHYHSPYAFVSPNRYLFQNGYPPPDSDIDSGYSLLPPDPISSPETDDEGEEGEGCESSTDGEEEGVELELAAAAEEEETSEEPKPLTGSSPSDSSVVTLAPSFGSPAEDPSLPWAHPFAVDEEL